MFTLPTSPDDDLTIDEPIPEWLCDPEFEPTPQEIADWMEAELDRLLAQEN